MTTRKNRKHLRKIKRAGSNQPINTQYSEYVGGARDNDPSCPTPGQPNNRNNLPYYPYISRGGLNSGFQYGRLLTGGKRRKTIRTHKKAKRGGACGGQMRESWFRGAYPVLLV